MAFLRAARWQNAAARNRPRDASGNMLADTAAIEQVARGLDIMMPEAIDLKFIAAPLTSNQLKEGRKRSAGRFQVCREGAYRWLRGRFSAEVGSRSSVIGRVNHPRRDLARSIGVCPA